ncbi:MAG: lipopolysaccharide heptosyltransferase II [Calditrichia bacterium]
MVEQVHVGYKSEKLNFTPRRILIIQTAFLGDVILTLPLLQKTKLLFPKAQIDFLTVPASKNLLETHPDIHELLIYDKRGKDKGLLNIFKWVGKIRNRNYDLALVPHRSLRSALLALPAKKSIGLDKSSGSMLFSEQVPYRKDFHEVNRNLNLLSSFGVDVQEKVLPELIPTEYDVKVVGNWKKSFNTDRWDNMAAIAPGSVWATKRWPVEYHISLIKALSRRGFQIVLIGGEADKEIGGQIEAEFSERVFNAIGIFTLRQSAALIRQCKFLVTNDSAPQHIAVAVGTPVITIFGPTVPGFGFYPYGEHDRIVQIENLPCRPCSIHGGKKCPIGTFECMRNIHAGRVMREIETLLKEISPKTEKK